MTGPDPASWLVVEKGWDVLTSEGDSVGTVHEVLGDRNADIFDGLAVKPNLLSAALYVPSEHVAEIVEGSVRLELRADEFERLDEHEEPPAHRRFRPD